MQQSLKDSLIETLFDQYLDQESGEIPWFMTYLYLVCNPGQELYSFSSPVLHRTIRYTGETTFKTELHMDGKVIYSDNSECPYIAGEHFCLTLELARACYDREENKRVTTNT